MLSNSYEEKKNSQKKDLELCRFMKLLHEPPSKLLEGESPDVKVLCFLWYHFRVRDEILYHTGHEV